MKSFLVKIGKAISVLRRDGFVLGLQRIARGFSAQFRKVDDGDVLFIAGGVGDSAMYRTQNVAEELDFNGISASVAYVDSPFLLRYADTFKVFVFHRVAYTDKIRKFIEKIKQQGKEIIFETDDLLYDAQFIRGTDYFKNINPLERKLYENGLGAEIVNDSYVKVCTTTTAYLADELRKKDKQVFIVPNKLSLQDIEIANAVTSHQSSVIKNTCHPELVSGSGFRVKPGMTKEKVKRSTLHAPRSTVRIGYFSGTISHNKDFATITDALVEIMEKHQNVELVLVGPLDVDNVLNRFSDRTSHLPYVQREKHFENVASVDINIVPLVVGDPFCESKSELKFFEAGIVGVPTVAVANRTFSEAISDGVDGFLAKDTAQWVEKLEKLILEPNLRQEMGRKARETALERYTTQSGKNEEYYAFLRNAVSARGGSASGGHKVKSL